MISRWPLLFSRAASSLSWLVPVFVMLLPSLLFLLLRHRPLLVAQDSRSSDNSFSISCLNFLIIIGVDWRDDFALGKIGFVCWWWPDGGSPGLPMLWGLLTLPRLVLMFPWVKKILVLVGRKGERWQQNCLILLSVLEKYNSCLSRS